MLVRMLISAISALTAAGTLAGAYLLTEQQHWLRMFVAIVVLEPIALFAAFTAVAVLIPRSGYLGWLRSTLRYR